MTPRHLTDWRTEFSIASNYSYIYLCSWCMHWRHNSHEWIASSTSSKWYLGSAMHAVWLTDVVITINWTINAPCWICSNTRRPLQLQNLLTIRWHGRSRLLGFPSEQCTTSDCLDSSQYNVDYPAVEVETKWENSNCRYPPPACVKSTAHSSQVNKSIQETKYPRQPDAVTARKSGVGSDKTKLLF